MECERESWCLFPHRKADHVAHVPTPTSNFHPCRAQKITFWHSTSKIAYILKKFNLDVAFLYAIYLNFWRKYEDSCLM